MMKRFVFLLLFSCILTIPHVGLAQLFVGVGMQSAFSSMPNADFPIDRYNSRAFLYKPMNHFHWSTGEIYAASYRPGRALLELNLNTKRTRATAKSTDAGGIYQRDVRFVTQSLSLAAGYAVVDKETFALYLGGGVDAGYMRLMTRVGYTTQIARTNYFLWARSPLLAVSGFGKMVFRSRRDAITSWAITPFFQFPLGKFDFLPLEQMLNQGSVQPYTQPLPARPWNVGLSVCFDLDFLGFLMD